MPSSTQDNMTTILRELNKVLGYAFKDLSELLWEALQQPGSLYRFVNGHNLLVDGNRRLALLGDAVATLYLHINWYPTNQSRGIADDARQQLLRNSNLARRGREMGMERFIQCCPGTPCVSAGMMATTMEAIIGAAYEEGGMDAVAKVMKAMDLGRI